MSIYKYFQNKDSELELVVDKQPRFVIVKTTHSMMDKHPYVFYIYYSSKSIMLKDNLNTVLESSYDKLVLLVLDIEMDINKIKEEAIREVWNICQR